MYISNVKAWLAEVVQKCNEEGLDPATATFMFVLFSSLDFEYVSFFKEKHEQISSYSGRNFHILTPIVYHNDLVPDEEWRSLRKQFAEAGIPIRNRPCILFFYLTTSKVGYKPVFFAGYDLPSFRVLETSLRDLIDLTIDEVSFKDTNLKRPPGYTTLTLKLEERLSTPNIIRQPLTPNVDVVKAIEQELSLGKVFISHSSEDKPFVRQLMGALAKEKVYAWLDEQEISAGDNIGKLITVGIKSSDALVVVLSPSSVKSEWVKFEIAQFLSNDDTRKVIPILLGAKPDNLPAPFREIQNLKYIDFSKKSDWHNNILALRSAIEAITSKASNFRTA
ncbi:MAG TPA: toll/interleukin-1 receptor domain-containing protein [Pyrinomonadaceae bacterium]|jgi:hypothetical protein|nr:toll/interleukin-1 receptor domain-containing protein [Pyrinomonadaceae bacterium]